MQIAEKETYSQRQTLLTEIEVVRQREEELHRQAHLYERFHKFDTISLEIGWDFVRWCYFYCREKTLLEEKMSAREDLVKRREDSVSKAEVDYERRLTDSLNTYELFYYNKWNRKSTSVIEPNTRFCCIADTNLNTKLCICSALKI